MCKAPSRGRRAKDFWREVAANPPRNMPHRVGFVYRTYKKATLGGCNGRCAGHDGSLSPIWLFRVLQCLGIMRQIVVDLGAGDGRVLVSALACGADQAFGYELPKNKACKYVLDAVLKKMDVSSGNLYSRRAHWVPSDIDKVAMHFLIKTLSF